MSINIQKKKSRKILIRPCKLNSLILILVRANFLSPFGKNLCIIVEYLISDNNSQSVHIVVIVFLKRFLAIMARLQYYKDTKEQ